jgi:hypothetical protein
MHLKWTSAGGGSLWLKRLNGRGRNGAFVHSLSRSRVCLLCSQRLFNQLYSSPLIFLHLVDTHAIENDISPPRRCGQTTRFDSQMQYVCIRLDPCAISSATACRIANVFRQCSEPSLEKTFDALSFVPAACHTPSSSFLVMCDRHPLSTSSTWFSGTLTHLCHMKEAVTLHLRCPF